MLSDNLSTHRFVYSVHIVYLIIIMSLLKPVYMKNSDLPINKSNRISDFDILDRR